MDGLEQDPLGSTGDLSADSGLTPEQLAEVPDINGGIGEDGGLDATPATPSPAPSQAQAQTIREAAAAYGLDLSGHGDDHAAFVHLVNQARAAQNNDYYTQLGRQLAPRYKDIQGYLETQKAKVAPAPEAPKPWQAPEFDERWLNLVERDEATGVFKARPGINPEYAEKVQAYADWMQGFNRNPMGLIQQAIQDQAREIARNVYAEQHAQVEQKSTIGSIIQQNAGWIYQTDEHGRRYTDQHGQFLPTPEGARYVAHIQTLAQSGVRDPRLQDQLARQLVQGELAYAHATRQQQQVAAQSPQARAAQARPPVNAGQAVAPARRANVPGATEPTTTGLSLAELLRQGMQEEGITDADFAPDSY